MKSLRKDLFREIAKTKGRFFSILLIVAIGVAFFTGVTTSADIMQQNIDRYYDDTNFRDFQVFSTLGFSEEDLQALQAFPDLAGIQASKSLEALVKQGESELAFKVVSLPSSAQGDEEYVDAWRLVEGRMPEAPNEAVLKASVFEEGGYQIGDTITLTHPDNNLAESLSEVTYTIVGMVESPNYMSFEMGNSTMGAGSIRGILAVPETNFTTDFYTEMLLKMEGSSAYNSFTSEYFDFLADKEAQLVELGEERAAIRFDEIKELALSKIEEGEKQFLEGKAAFDEAMSQARNEISAGLQAIQQQSANLTTLEATAASQFAAGFASIEQQRNDLSAQKASLEKQLADFSASLPALQQQLSSLQQRISAIDAQLAVETNPATIEALKQEKSALSQEVSTLQTTITSTAPTLQAGIAATQQGLSQLDQAKSDLQAKQKASQQKISEGRSLLYNSQVALQEATLTLNKEEQTGLQEFEKARLEIEKAKKEFSTLEAPEWIVLNREKNYSYMDYKMATNQMAAISQVFPIFFILVAALVCLTTMTRMVEEQRGYIGTMKALGYGKTAIASKYMLYAAVAALLGSLLGALIGMNLFPTIIYNVWRMMFEVPDVVLTYDIGLIVLATVFFTGASLLVTFFAAQSSLKESPALLMRPKAPTVGKRILLERMGFVWNRLSFIEKVTARNIFRYKKRFLMSVIGIAGCFALLLSGFGIRDSISGIVEKQFGTIQMYDGTVTLEKGVSIAQEQAVLQQIQQLEHVEQAHAITSLRTTMELAGKEQGVTLYALDASFPEEDYFTFDSLSQNKPAHVDAQGVLISEKMAKDLQVESGDTLRFTYDKKNYEVVVADVFENYLNHMMVMSDAYYQEVFEVLPAKDSIVLQVDDAAYETQLSVQINDLDHVNSVDFFTALKEGFANTVESLNLIVVVLIISAGLLAFVVLYNLTNVNISERMREIATIKVLGFYDKEVESYVYRENIVLTIIGSFAGIFLGIVFHRFIMEIVEQDSVIFGKTIMMLSYFYSFAITMLFAFLVNFAMRKNLKRINMIESLKSVE